MVTQSGVHRLYLQVSRLSLDSPLSNMANQCPICSKSFPSETALRGHTGTNETMSRRAHTCHKCNRRFCSQKAMEQHRDAPSHSIAPSSSVAPSHITNFRCEVCKRSFGSKQAVLQHETSSSHKQKLARTNPAIEVGGYSGSGSVSSESCVVGGIVRTLTCYRGFVSPSTIPHIRSDLHFD